MSRYTFWGRTAVMACVISMVGMFSAPAFAQECTDCVSTGYCPVCTLRGAMLNAESGRAPEDRSDSTGMDEEESPIPRLSVPEASKETDGNHTPLYWVITLSWGEKVVCLQRDYGDGSASSKEGKYEPVDPNGDVHPDVFATYSASEGSRLVGKNKYVVKDQEVFDDNGREILKVTSDGGDNGDTTIRAGNTLMTKTKSGGKLTKMKQERDGITLSETNYQREVDSVDGTLYRQRVTRVTFNSDGSKRLATSISVYYRTGPNKGKLWFTVEPEGVVRYLAANGFDKGVKKAAPEDPCDLDDSTKVADENATHPKQGLKFYASHVYDYWMEGDFRDGKKKSVASGCASCSGGQSMLYDYAQNAVAPTDAWNDWVLARRTTYPDGKRVVELMNQYEGSVYHIVQHMSGDPATTIDQVWITHTKYDDQGRVLEVRTPRACRLAGYATTSSGGWTTNVTPSDSGTDGMVRVTTYHSASGNVEYQALRKGTGGTTYYLSKVEYIENPHRSGEYLISRMIEYPEETTDPGTAATIETSYSYTYYTGVAGLRDGAIRTQTTTLPVVATQHNGSGTANTREVFYAFDDQGTTDTNDDLYYLAWRKHEDGALDYSELDELSRTVKRVTDADTTQTFAVSPPTGWSTPTGAGLHMVATYTYDDWGRTQTVTGPDGRKSVTAYASTSKEVTADSVVYETTTQLVSLSTQYMDSSGKYDHVPMSISVTDVAGRSLVSATGLPTSGSDGNTSGGAAKALCNDWNRTASTLDAAFSGTLTSRTESIYDDEGRLEKTVQWTDAGDTNADKYETLYAYDQATGRRIKTTSPDGTISKTVYDQLGRTIERWRGTDDGEMTSNMKKITSSHYDADGHLEESRSFHGDGANDYYATKYKYDWRERTTDMRGADRVASRSTFDNLDRVTVSQTYYDANEDFEIGATELRGKHESFHDDLGRMYKSTVYDVSASGVVGHSMTEESWYDARGRLVKSKDANKLLSKTRYDSAGRMLANYICYDDAETTYADALTVTGDTVIEQSEVIYDARGHAVVSTSFQRRHNDTTSTGALTAANSVYWVSVTWYDDLGRSTHAASYGRDGAEGGTRYVYDGSGNLIDTNSSGIPDVAEATAPEPDSSDDYIVTKVEYDARGRAYQQIDNAGTITHMVFDDLGRTTQVYENYIDGSVTQTKHDADRLTETVYDAAGRLHQLKAHNPKGSGNGVEVQTTTYLYESDFSGALLTNVIYPDSSDSDSSGSDQVKITYDRLGRRVTTTDQNGTVHTFTYDSSGRLVSDAVTTLGSGVDGAVRRIQLTYDDLGRRTHTTSYDAATGGNVVNEVRLTYGDGDGNWGSAIKSEQAHSGAVTTGTPAVAYAYDDGAGVGTEAQFLRLSKITYPGASRELHYRYPTSGVGSVLNRVSDISADSSGTTMYASYDYLGVGSVIRTQRPEVTGGLELTHDPDSDATYKGLDRFGRVVDHTWRNTAGTTTFDRQRYGHDRAGNRTWRENVVSKNLSTPIYLDEHYSHDGLHRLADFGRGELAGSHPNYTGLAGTPSAEQAFNLDTLGNWRQFIEKASGTTQIDQTRHHNAANEIAGNSGNPLVHSVGTTWAQPTHDANGNMTTLPHGQDPTQGLTAVYDGWNRLVKISDATTSDTVAAYEWDGEGRRTVKKTYVNNQLDETRHFYYHNHSIIEERVDGTAGGDLQVQYLWGLRYVDDLILRDRDTTGNGSPDERHYALQDANFRVTAIVNTSGAITERYRYTPYGQRTVLNADFTLHTNPDTGDFAFTVGHQGLYHDAESGLIYNRARMLHVTLGRFTQRDPLDQYEPGGGYHDGMSLYQYIRSQSVIFFDPHGLAAFILLYDSHDPMFEQWAHAVKERIKSGGRTYYGEGDVRYNPSVDTIHLVAVNGTAAFQQLEGIRDIAYLATFGHGAQGKIWWSYNSSDGEMRSVVTGIPGYRLNNPDAADQIDLSRLARLDYSKKCPVVIEFYHCSPAAWYSVDEHGKLVFSGPNTNNPSPPGNGPAQESVISHFKNLLETHQQGVQYRVYGAAGGISNGRPWSRGWPRTGGGEKKTGTIP